MSSTSLILGITGQDGSYLAELLLDKGYEVHGMYRRTSTGNLQNIQQILDRITLHQGDMADSASIQRIIREVRPHEIYNLADQDNVRWSFNTVTYSMDITAAAVARTLEAAREVDFTVIAPKVKFFQPVSATMFGDALAPQTEQSPLNPQSPYACAKACAYHLARYYRQTYGMFVSTAIFYNHDSPRRSSDYLLHKICRGAVRIAKGLDESISLGNLDLRVDIGYAREYMEAAIDIQHQKDPGDYIISSGYSWTIRELVAEAFSQLACGMLYDLESMIIKDGSIGSICQATLIGDSSKAKAAFGFEPKCTPKYLIQMLLKKYMEDWR